VVASTLRSRGARARSEPGVNPGAASLRQVLERARAAGSLGPGPVEAHIGHSEGFADAAVAALGRVPAAFADLGTGGGVPGLVLSERWRAARGVLVDSNHRRCEALREAITQLGLDERVEVIEERAEQVGRPGPFRERFELVTARSFAEPAITAEIAAGLVEVGGALIVSEPPDPAADRWFAKGLDQLGFGPAEPVERAGAHFVVVRKTKSAPERFPRRVGRPAKRPLW
jgi:16S rRNA (guanine527-N7)-methyltransferase